ncbi:MAG: ribosomal protein S18-alanine N-acetyltransferase [Firmicutes bacterium]|nr:ribosomal protein S18-alanine N-acetyltransferase [Bacillota bacterium]
MEVEIIPMKRADLRAVIEIEKVSFSTPWSRYAFLAELYDNKRARYFVAKDKADGAVVGYVGVWLILGEAHITNIAVHPDFRKKGIGEKLLVTAIDYVESQGVNSITLEVRASNTVAQRLYRKTGFVSVGIRPGYYRDDGEDAVIMWRNPDIK